MQKQITKTPWHSWCTGQIAEGCKLCVRGRKLVIFLTGLCGQGCFYCPISEQKYGKDVVFANEWRITNPDDPVEMLKEARLTEAQGASLTGGDPLAKTKRCCDYIRLLKKTHGKQFHIHLYTPLRLVTKDRLAELYDAGLDEIRLHPNLDDSSLWERIDLATTYDWTVGIEIPAIPGYEDRTKKLLDAVAGKVAFVNLNELELSDTQTRHYALHAKGFVQKDSLSYGVKGSKEMALRMLAHACSKKLRAHYCTAKLKDGVQVKNRLTIRSHNAKLPFDDVTEEGTLLRGCAYLADLAPGMKYREKLAKADNHAKNAELERIHKELATNGFPEKSVVVDPVKCRLLLPRALVKEKASVLKKKGLVPALVEEYPTADAIEMDVEFL